MKLPRASLLLLLLVLGGCTGTPPGVVPVQGFELQRYLGTWYEIARLDHSFERGLEAVTANYTRNEDGTVAVVNRGYRPQAATWKQAEGVARFVDEETTAHLKVSFFGPFYSSYVVFELGEEYDYAFVAGYNRDYLWLLSRTPNVDESVRARFLARAEELGFAVDELVMVDQSRHASP